MRLGTLQLVCLVLPLSCLNSCSGSVSRSTISPLPRGVKEINPVRYDDFDSGILLLSLRGGASRRKTKSRTGSLSKTATGKKKVGTKEGAEKGKKPHGTKLIENYKNMPPLIRVHLTALVLFTCLGLLLGEELAQAVFALDPMSLVYGMQIWRPFTSASFLGKPSMGSLFSGYYLVQYGSQLERAYGTPQYLIFMLTQLGLLTLLGSLLGQPFIANSVITAMLHVLSRTTPTAKVTWLFFKVPHWTLPYGLALADCLQAQSAAALVPHLLGILAGHFYFFHKLVWPKTGGEDWLAAPDFLVGALDPNAAKKAAAKESLNKALKTRKKGRGKKLGR